MASHRQSLQLVLLAAVLVCCASSDGTGVSKLHRLLQKRDAGGEARPHAVVAVDPAKAKEFLAPLRRPRRNIWDRSRPDVQQWIQQFMHMGYDEARLETDLAYWMDQSRSRDQGRQHHYDENSPLAPQDPSSYRHGANVNYDYY